MYRLMRVRVTETLFDALEDHAASRSQQAERRVYVSDIVRFALKAYLADHSRQQQFGQSICDPSGGASVVAPQDIQIALGTHTECRLDA